jgi:hypothetical protein
MIHDEERRPTRGFMTSSRRDDEHKESRRGDRANTKYQENVRIKLNQEGDHHGSSLPEMPRRRLPPTNHTTENAMRRSRQRQGETRHEDDVREGAIDCGKVQKYILNKVAVSCEGEQAEKTRRGIPPPDLPHLTCIIRHGTTASFESSW